MWFRRRWAAALTLIGVTLLSGCGGPPPEKRSTEELLVIGQARLDEIAIPAGWQLSGGKGASRSQGKLRWTRDYRANISPDAAGRELEDQLHAAGWKRDGRTCQASKGMVCRSYAKGGLTILLTASNGTVCPPGHPVCTDVSISMRENFEKPI